MSADRQRKRACSARAELVLHLPPLFAVVIPAAQAIAIRALPLVLFVSSAELKRGWLKLVTVATYLLVVLAAVGPAGHGTGPLTGTILGLLYFALLGVALHAASGRWLFHTGVRKAALLGLIGLFSVALPGLLGSAGMFVQLAGWELMFAAYSYGVERRDGRAQLTDTLFFLLVDPTLVYPERAQRTIPRPARAQAGLRVLLGLVAIVFNATLLAALMGPQSDWVDDVLAIDSPASYGSFLGYYALRFCAGYAIHSGVASVQVGALRLLGYRIGERYHYPFVAASPAEFWRRWNIYIGSWFRRYVFAPLALRLRRRGVGPRWASGIAVLTTFVAAGVAHEYIVIVRTGHVAFGALLAFTFQGLALLAFLLVSGALRWAADRLVVLRSRPLVGLSRLLAHAAFAHVLAITFWLALPAFGGAGLPESLSRLWQGL